MQVIMYAGEEFLTGDEIADALLAFCRALGAEARAEIVGIPIREDDGSVATAKFLIGPASQIVTKTATGQWPEIEDHELVRRLQQITRSVESPQAEPWNMPGVTTDDND